MKALYKLQSIRAELAELFSFCVYRAEPPALMCAAEAVKAWDTMALH